MLSTDKEPGEKKKILQNDFDIDMTKELESEVFNLCNLSEGIEERGIKKGIAKGIAIGIEREREEGTLRAIENLMDTLKLTAEQAMTALKVPETDRLKYADRIDR